MISDGEYACPACGGNLERFDTVKRIVKSGYGKTRWERINRVICTECGTIHRELPRYLIPFKHYERRIVEGFVCRQLSIFDLEFEDYPCESTIREWQKTIKG